MYADLVKQVVRITASTGVATIVSTAAKQAMPSYPQAAKGFIGGLKVARVAGQRIGVIAASGILGGLVADQAMTYSDKKVDEAAEAFRKQTEWAAKFASTMAGNEPTE